MKYVITCLYFFLLSSEAFSKSAVEKLCKSKRDTGACSEIECNEPYNMKIEFTVDKQTHTVTKNSYAGTDLHSLPPLILNNCFIQDINNWYCEKNYSYKTIHKMINGRYEGWLYDSFLCSVF